MTTTTTPASPKKLRDGSWGALAQSDSVSVGDTLQITTRAGKTWAATVSTVIWSGKGVSICATETAVATPTTPSRRMGSGRGQAAKMPGYSSYCTDNDYCRCYDCAS
ncbi:hypothetical protein LCGC14_1755860 [marine sediment metagenome]|uniref:Uncharacterized protein n=1 Tax=marine sediment metagenome TaxID=412755 RepID=A0A0F9H2M2_9ZZZZ